VIQRTWARGCLFIVGISVQVDGVENLPLDEPCIFVLNHNSNIDPWLAMGYGKVTPIFIFKRELLWAQPHIGILGFLMGHIPINRHNREESIQHLNDAASQLKKRRRSLCIFPEGTRSQNGKLQEFKKGAFHVAVKSGLQLVPGVIRGSFDMWRPHTLFPTTGVILLTWLKPIKVENRGVEELQGLARATIQEQLQQQPASVLYHSTLWTHLRAIFISLVFLSSVFLFLFAVLTFLFPPALILLSLVVPL